MKYLILFILLFNVHRAQVIKYHNPRALNNNKTFILDNINVPIKYVNILNVTNIQKVLKYSIINLTPLGDIPYNNPSLHLHIQANYLHHVHQV